MTGPIPLYLAPISHAPLSPAPTPAIVNRGEKMILAALALAFMTALVPIDIASHSGIRPAPTTSCMAPSTWQEDGPCGHPGLQVASMASTAADRMAAMLRP